MFEGTENFLFYGIVCRNNFGKQMKKTFFHFTDTEVSCAKYTMIGDVLMLDKIIEINGAVNGFVWGVPAMICIVFVGLWIAVRTKCIQIRKFGFAMKSTLGKVFSKTNAKEGSVTPFQAVCTALAATVGTGNIAGVAGAIAVGGPGAVFWMWMSALLGMGTKFAEVVLAIRFREKNAKGDWVGGPMYFIKNGLSKKWSFLAYLYAVLGILAVFGTGNATQVNTIVTAVESFVNTLTPVSDSLKKILGLVIGIVITILLILILLGGLKRIASVTEKLVPFMAVLYIILALGVVIINIKNVPAAFGMIFKAAFTPAAVTGGIVGSMFTSMKKGVSRGIFSNEAGLGTGSIAHAAADTENAVHQGCFGIFEVFMDTLVICTLTALVILTSGITVNYGAAAGAELTISGFTSAYGGWVSLITAIAMCCFAFSTTIGWGLYGVRCVEFIFGSKFNRIFLVVYSCVALLGATMNLGLIWDIADTCNGLMAIPNLIALLLLSGTVVDEMKNYFAKQTIRK